MVRFWLAVPSGASTGVYEIIELYEDKNHYTVRGSSKAIKPINETIAPALLSKNN
jgi:enolase